VKKSKENLARRQTENKQRLDWRWQPERDKPVLEPGNLRYEVGDRVRAIGCGGLGLMLEVVKCVGLTEAIDQQVEVLKRHLPYHESDHILSLVYNFLTGGQCLEDLELRRQDSVFLDAVGAQRIPAPTTAGDFLRRFDQEQVEALMAAANRARASVWRAQPEEQRDLAILDVDGTIVETQGRCKERMDMSYNGRWGFGPLVVSLANSQEPVFVVNRPASRPSHDGAALWIDRAITWAQDDAGFKEVLVRGDTDFSLTAKFDGWDERGVQFVFGMDANPSFVRRAKELQEDGWGPLVRPTKETKRKRQRPPKIKDAVVQEKGFRVLTQEEEWVAEMPYRPCKAKKTYRLVVVRKKIRVTEGQLRLEDEIRYLFYVTNLPPESWDPAAVVFENNARCHQENLIEQLKNGVQATRLPVREFDANWTYLVTGALAWSLKAWTGLLLPGDLGARALLKMEFRRFLQEIMQVPAQILTTGRRRVFRLLAVNRWSNLLLEGIPWLRRWRFA
jgi:hypothetical protein